MKTIRLTKKQFKLLRDAFMQGASSHLDTLNDDAWDVDESDIVGIHYQWVIHGSDHSWSAGESKTLYVMVKENTAGGRIYSGDSAFQNYGAWTMEAVALPATIGDGS